MKTRAVKNLNQELFLFTASVGSLQVCFNKVHWQTATIISLTCFVGATFCYCWGYSEDIVSVGLRGLSTSRNRFKEDVVKDSGLCSAKLVPKTPEDPKFTLLIYKLLD